MAGIGNVEATDAMRDSLSHRSSCPGPCAMNVTPFWILARGILKAPLSLYYTGLFTTNKGFYV